MSEYDGLKANKNINPLRKSAIQPQSLAEIVAERLKTAILNREVALGEALSEEKIATAMEVSRTPVREALTLLQMQGLITILPRRGSFVFKPDSETLQALVEYRLHLELLAAGWAVERAPEAVHLALSEALRAMEQGRADDDSLAYATADTAFHEAFFTYCGNPFFVAAYGIAAGRLAALRAHLSEQLDLHHEQTLQEHHKIADAVRHGDVGQLQTLLRQHIEAMAPNYARALERMEAQT